MNSKSCSWDIFTSGCYPVSSSERLGHAHFRLKTNIDTDLNFWSTKKKNRDYYHYLFHYMQCITFIVWTKHSIGLNVRRLLQAALIHFKVLPRAVFFTTVKRALQWTVCSLSIILKCFSFPPHPHPPSSEKQTGLVDGFDLYPSTRHHFLPVLL